jgi:hypothetical protein
MSCASATSTSCRPQQKQMKMKTTFPLSLIDNRVLLEFPRADLDDCKRAIGGVVEDGITRSVTLSALLLCQILPNLQVTTSLLRFNPEF